MRLSTLGLVVFLSGITLIYSHALCRDGTNAAAQPLTFCTDYVNASCCSVARDLQLQQQFNNLGNISPGCSYFVKKSICGDCDPWAAHIVGDTSVNRTVPWYCPGFCKDVFSNCSTETLTASASPFYGVSQITSVWPTDTAFCSQFANDAALSLNGGYCYNGSPYVEPARPPFNSNQGLCLTKVVNAANELNAYISMAVPNDNTNRIFLGGRNGVIRIYQITNDNSPFPFIGTFLNITDRSEIIGEGGLLDIAFHPNYSTNGRFFLSFTCDPAEHPECVWKCNTSAQCLFGGSCSNGGCTDHVLMLVVAEFAVSSNPNVANATEVKRLLQISQPGANHKAGWIEFGPDGYLYMSTGDGGGWGGSASQNINYLNGKILRIDVNVPQGSNLLYQAPPDNPYVGINGLDEIYARGMRNPWRASFDAVTGDLWVGDVGQDQIEEIDLIKKGGNYGWRKYEGYTTFQAGDIPFSYTGPAAFYSHAGRVGACVIGGHVYRGSKDTCNYGRYIFADLEGEFFASIGAPSADFSYAELAWKCGSNAGANPSCSTVTTFQKIYTFGEDQNRELYIVTDNGVYMLAEQWRCPTLSCNGTSSAPISTGSVTTRGVTTGSVTTSPATSASVTTSRPITTATVSITTGTTTAQITTGGIVATSSPCGPGPAQAQVIQCASRWLNIRGNCLDLVCAEQNLAPSSIITVPANNYTRSTLTPQPNPAYNLVLKIGNVTGTYNGLNSRLSVYVDSPVTSQAIAFRIRYDFTGDGTFDRSEVYFTYPPNPTYGDYEQILYDLANLRTVSGTFADLVRGTVELTTWSAFGTCCNLTLQADSATYGTTSAMYIPFDNLQWELPIGNAPCGFAAALTTANPLCNVVTSGRATSGRFTTGKVTSGSVTTSRPVSTGAVTTSRVTTGQEPLTTSPLTTDEATTSEITSGAVTTGQEQSPVTTGQGMEESQSLSSKLQISFVLGLIILCFV